MSSEVTVKVKGIVHFEINFWYGMCLCFRSIFNFDIFLGQTVLVCQSSTVVEEVLNLST